MARIISGPVLDLSSWGVHLSRYVRENLVGGIGESKYEGVKGRHCFMTYWRKQVQQKMV